MTDAPPAGGPVRVLQLMKGLGPGGAERLLVSFARLADPSQVELQAAFLLPWKDHLVPELAALGVPATCLRGGRPMDLRWAVRLRRLVRRERIDLVHVHSPLVAAVARVVLRFPGRHRPLMVGTEHNVWSSHHRATRWANRLTGRLEQATVAVSEQVRDSMSMAAAARTEVVIHGADVAGIAARRPERDTARADLGLAHEDVVVVTVANLRANKDYPTLLEAADQLSERAPTLRFISVGQGPLADELAARHTQLGLGDRFRFLGYLEDPIRVLEAGDVFCLSSRYEGLSIALIEAMAAGLPVVATAVGGVPTVVRDGVEGRLVPARDPAALAAALLEMADPAVRTRFGRAASARSRSFAAEAAVERQQELYRTLVGRVDK